MSFLTAILVMIGCQTKEEGGDRSLLCGQAGPLGRQSVLSSDLQTKHWPSCRCGKDFSCHPLVLCARCKVQHTHPPGETQSNTFLSLTGIQPTECLVSGFFVNCRTV